MCGVCTIDLQCSGVILSKCAQLEHGQECHELTLRHKGHQCAWCYWIWHAQRMTHICAYTSLGGLHPSKWELPFLPKSVRDRGESRSDDRTRKVMAKVGFSCALLPEAARENSCRWNSLSSQSGTLSCCDTVQAGQNVFGDLATDRHTASTKDRYNMFRFFNHSG